jgi:cytochrome c-type biogenesis protein CcmH/NrfG
VNNKKYLVGLIGLIIGFTISFVFTQRYNRQNAAAAPPSASQSQFAQADSNPKDYFAQIEAAKAAAEARDREGVAKYLERAYKAAPVMLGREPGAASFLADVYLGRQNYADAERLFKMAVESDPQDVESMGHLVEIYAMNKNIKAAEDLLSKIKQVDPANQGIATLETAIADAKAGKPVTPHSHP